MSSEEDVSPDNRHKRLPSPPTSPLQEHQVSPNTSPFAACAQQVESPEYVASTETSSASSSPDCNSSKRFKKYTKMSRSTLSRKLFGGDESSDDNAECVDDEEKRIISNEEFTGHAIASKSPLEGFIPAAENDEHDRMLESDASSLDTTSTEPEYEAELHSSDEERGSRNSVLLDNEAEKLTDSDVPIGHYDDSSDVGSGSDSDESDGDLLYENASVTTNEAILLVLKQYIKEGWTKTSLNSNIKLNKRLLPTPNNMPSSCKAMLSKLNKLAPFLNDVEHFYCSECQLPKPSSSDVCNGCGSEKTGIFYEFPIENQIKFMFEHRNLASIIDSHRVNRTVVHGSISDIQDGVEYKKVRSDLHGQYDLVLILNSDGVSLSSSSKQQLWGILSSIVELPAPLRFSFMIISGVHVDRCKPKMNYFLAPFVQSMKKLFETGVEWIHPSTKVKHCSKVVSPILCADAPAKAIMLNVKQFNARYGCNVCEQKTRKIQQGPQDGKRATRAYVFQELQAPLRTGNNMNQQGHFAEQFNKSRKGVVGAAVVCELPLFDRALCISAEYLHNVLLGVVKYFVNTMFFERGPWYIGNHISEVNDFLLSIKVPDFVKRLPRIISDIKFFKGSEFRALLLFYMLPILKVYLPDKYFQHWILLTGAIYLLLTDCISETDLRAAGIMLRCFVREISELYGDKFYTYNVHNLEHLEILVRRWGPLWATSAFDSEKFNGFISAHIHGTKHLGKELLNNIKVIQSVNVLENITKFHLSETNVSPLKDSNVELLGKNVAINLEVKERGALHRANVVKYLLHSRIKINSEIFTSKVYDINKKRANSFVQFCRNNPSENIYEYGEILHFVKNCENGLVYCLINIYKIDHVNIIFHSVTRYQIRHVLPVKESGIVDLFPASCLMSKVIKAGQYLCVRPNSFEINL